MLHSGAAFDNVRRAFHLARLKTDVALVLIACRLYRDTQKRIPQDLAEVVAAGLLDEVPIDPFTGNPLSYDATRGMLWSPGFADPEEGTEGSGEAGPIRREQLVWPLAP